MIDTVVSELIAGLLLAMPLAAAAVLAFGRLQDRRSADFEDQVACLRDELGALLAEQPKAEHAFTGLLVGVDRRVAEEVLHPLLIELSGRAEAMLRTAALHARLADGLDRKARSWNWRQRRRAAFLLTLRPEDGDLVARLLRDRKPVVAYAAAESVVHATSEQAVPALIELLGSDEPHLRFAAQHALIRMRDRAELPLIGYIEQTSNFNDAIWALDVAVHIASPRFADLAVALASHPSPRVRAVVARLLGAIAAADTTEVLVGLLSDEDPRVRLMAVEALGRMGWAASAPQLGFSLRDRSFDVRQAAARSLARLGAVGELVLRHHTNDEDRYASEAANAALISLTAVRETANVA